MYQVISPRVERGMSAVDAPNGERVAYCDTFEHARLVASALNVLTAQQCRHSSDQSDHHHTVAVADRCPCCQAPFSA